MPGPDQSSTVMTGGRTPDPNGRRWIAATALPADHAPQRGPVLISAGRSLGGYGFFENRAPDFPAAGSILYRREATSQSDSVASVASKRVVAALSSLGVSTAHDGVWVVPFVDEQLAECHLLEEGFDQGHPLIEPPV
jgi:hypothetical protein